MSKDALFKDTVDRINQPGLSNSKRLKDAKEEQELFNYDLGKKVKLIKHKLFVWSIIVLWIFAIVIIIVRLFHFLLPKACFWLDSSQVDQLDRILFSGSIGGFIGKYIEKIVE